MHGFCRITAIIKTNKLPVLSRSFRRKPKAHKWNPDTV